MREHPEPRISRLLLGAYLIWKFCTLTFLYGAVFLWHQRRSPSLAEVSAKHTLGELRIKPQHMAHAKQDFQSGWGGALPIQEALLLKLLQKGVRPGRGLNLAPIPD